VPDDAGLVVALAEIHQKKDDLPAAIRLLERFAGRQKDNVFSRVALAAMYLEKDEVAHARAAIGEVLAALQSEPAGRADKTA